MNTTQKAPLPQLRFHPNAYRFMFAALRRAQQKLGRSQAHGPDDERAHISGPELLDGIREFALEQFGLMARTVFQCWGVQATDDFGRMVFELIERGEMRKTDNDQLADFFDVFDFEEALDRRYEIDLSHAF
ncbi:MAG TPA: Minf_1886 family protein [Planctomycetaceae bacterium]|nr:Minf_1886 family protein [Planctomycetaceae bacterium]